MSITEPQQTFDPFYLIGGSKLGEFLVNAVLENNIDAYTNAFNIYIIAAFINETSGETVTSYRTAKHTGCSIIPTAIGGDTRNNMPIEVHYSNVITMGKVNKLSDDFEFTADS